MYLKKHAGTHSEYPQVFKFQIIDYTFGDGRETLESSVEF